MGPERRSDPPRPDDGIISVEVRFASMRQVQAELAPNLSTEGVFIPHPEPFPPSTVVRFAVVLPDDFRLLEGVGVVLWSRSEDLGPGKPAGMALHFASLGPRSQELINTLVASLVEDGGRPFDLERGVDEEGFIPTDALVGRDPLADPPPSPQGPRPPRELGAQLKVRGAEEDEAPPAVPAAPGPTSEAEAPLDGVLESPSVSDQPRASLAPSEWGLDLEEATSGLEEGGQARPSEASAEVPVADHPNTGEGGWRTADEPIRPPSRRAGLPPRSVDATAEAPAGGPATEGVPSAAELVAEVIADREEQPVEADASVDTFADSLRRMGGLSSPPGVGPMPEVTIVPRDEDDVETPRRTVPWGALAAVAVVLVVAAVGFFGREQLASLLVGDPGAPGVEEVDRGDRPPPGVATPRAAARPTSTPPGAEPTAAASPAAVAPTAPPVTPAAATATPTPRSPPLDPATRVVDIRWVEEAGQTVVTILADGALSEGRVRVSTMSGPPRVLVRLLRFDRFPRYELAAGTAELERVRTGHHPDQTPPALHVVLDLAGPAVRLESSLVTGAEVTLTLSR